MKKKLVYLVIMYTFKSLYSHAKHLVVKMLFSQEVKMGVAQDIYIISD